jgi:hypothetical protein
MVAANSGCAITTPAIPSTTISFFISPPIKSQNILLPNSNNVKI